MVVNRFVVALLLLWLFPVTSAAAAAAGPGAEPTSALEFRLDHNFSLEHLAGTTVSWRHHSGETSSWRLGVTPTYRHYAMNDPHERHEQRDHGLGLEWQWLRGFGSRSLARPYWGAGVLAGVVHEESSWDYNREGTDESSNYSTTYQAGLLGTLGAEFVIAGRVTLGAEYSSTLTWLHQELEHTYAFGEDVAKYETRRTSYQFTTRAVALTVGIRF